MSDKQNMGGKITGWIFDERQHPIKGAKISLINVKDKISNVSESMGNFQLSNTPFGMLTIKVDAYGHESATRFAFSERCFKRINITNLSFTVYVCREVAVNQNEQMAPVVFRLAIDENVMGLPRMVFVLFFGCIGVLGVVCCALLISWIAQRRKNKKYYSFSLLPQKPEQRKLFEDDDDLDETELFRTPVKGTYKVNSTVTEKTYLDILESDDDQDIVYKL